MAVPAGVQQTESRATLQSRYTAETGTVYLTGVQALLRVMLDQARADRHAGVRTAGLVSGYPGSPLGGVDLELGRNAHVFEAAGIHHQLGLNEELAATAIFGTQLIHDVPGAKFDGVFGLWFGKAPGVERAADAIHHANFHGVARNGGVLAVAGDDPHARSTILPTDSNALFSSFYMPVLAPGNVQEVLDLGRHGFALSRAAGLWVGFKLVADVADSSGTVEVGLHRVEPRSPTAEFDGAQLEPRFRANEAGPPMLEREREIVYGRLELARRYARLNGINRIVVDTPNAKRGILAAGKTYYDLRDALFSLGLGDAGLAAAGLRILKMNMLFPFDDETATEFATGLEEILVVEDKRPFLEGFLKQALYGRPGAPRIVGKSDARGSLLLTACGELTGDAIRRAVASWLGMADSVREGAVRRTGAAKPLEALPESRTPYFCSGCPHNRGLQVPEGSVVGAGIGCHIMTLWMGRVFGEVTGYTQMGGEGAQWVGLKPFTDVSHFYQNLGDGTYAHSGSLAIRFAVAANLNITYKILYNSAVAMTGGQSVFGGTNVAGTIAELLAEGVKKIIVTTDEPRRYAGLQLPASASVRHRDELVAAERELAAVAGVTVLINDQQCAAEKRRLRKRGQLEKPPRRVVINERICEGCGDCGAKSNCLSVEPVETEFGRKTRINQSSCNQDYSCLLGDCPSFMTVEGGRASPKVGVTEPALELAEPASCVPRDDFSVFMAGIGGTGVITVNQILGVAAMLAGRHVTAIDQIGASQKAGPVVAHLKISAQQRVRGSRIMSGCADVFLAFDVLCAAEASNLAVGDPATTVLVANIDEVPTGGTVTDVTRRLPSTSALRERLESVTREDRQFISALNISRVVFGNEVGANVVLVGAAYQAGAIPLPLEAIEAAIRLNSTAVDMNLRAFRWGRLAVQAPDLVREALKPRSAEASPPSRLDATLETLLGGIGLGAVAESRARLRVAELCRYQDSAYARQYLDFLHAVRAEETARLPTQTAITEAAMIGCYKLMAYKDEYEVARLITDAYDRNRASGAMGSGARLRWHLHPTFLRSIGVQSKVAVGPWFIPFARLLARMKVLRGTRFDVFGIARVRRLERDVAVTYKQTILRALGALNDANHKDVAALASLPDLVRGYEDVKARTIEVYERRRTELLARIESVAGETTERVASLRVAS